MFKDLFNPVMLLAGRVVFPKAKKSRKSRPKEPNYNIQVKLLTSNGVELESLTYFCYLFMSFIQI